MVEDIEGIWKPTVATDSRLWRFPQQACVGFVLSWCIAENGTRTLASRILRGRCRGMESDLETLQVADPQNGQPRR